MSYILDALKKAERDRGIAKAPSLLAVHDLRPPAKTQWWIAAAALVLTCAASFAWFVLVWRKQASPQVVLQREASPPAESARLRVPAVSETKPPVRLSTPEPTPVARKSVPAPQVPTASAQPPLEPAPQAAVSRQADAAVRPNPESSSVPAAPVTGTAAPAAPAAPLANAGSLRDAVAQMNMTVLVYAEGKEERLVFINGRKYGEGDYVDERYLLESIRPDGAILSYGGDRAVLRPGSR